MANILLQFPPPPPVGNITALEQEGVMKDVSENVAHAFTIPDCPDVVLQSDSKTHPNTRLENAQMAFLPHHHTVWKRAMHAWSRSGLVGALEEISESREEISPLMLKMSTSLLQCVHKLTSLRESLFPQMGLSDSDLVEKYSHVSNWQSCPVQALSWHPHVAKLAVAFRDDSVHVFGSMTSVNPVLKHKRQRKVADLAWQPLSSSVLAVACQSCILIWHVEPTSLAVNPSSSTVQILEYPGHTPVTSLAWNPDSSHLVSASPRQAEILVWDVPREVCIPLKRGRGGGVALLQYSPDSSKLFTGTTSTLFRVWETRTWHAELWSRLSGRCSAACWSPDGTVLVFAMCGEGALYAVRYSKGEMSAVSNSVLLADVSALQVSDAMGGIIRTGGEIKSIVWDKTGERMAVLFEGDEKGHNSLVAVFKSTVHPILQILPGGFVRGHKGESAHHIAFQPSYSKGALLSVVWSSGRVGYIPLNFVPAEDIHQMGPPALNSMAPLSPLSPHHFPRERI